MKTISEFHVMFFVSQDGNIDLKILAKVLSPESEVTEV